MPKPGSVIKKSSISPPLLQRILRTVASYIGVKPLALYILTASTYWCSRVRGCSISVWHTCVRNAVWIELEYYCSGWVDSGAQRKLIIRTISTARLRITETARSSTAAHQKTSRRPTRHNFVHLESLFSMHYPTQPSIPKRSVCILVLSTAKNSRRTLRVTSLMTPFSQGWGMEIWQGTVGTPETTTNIRSRHLSVLVVCISNTRYKLIGSTNSMLLYHLALATIMGTPNWTRLAHEYLPMEDQSRCWGWWDASPYTR